SRIGALEGQLSSLEPRVITQSRTMPNQYSVERLQPMVTELQNHRTELLAKFRAEDRLVQEVDEKIRDTRAALEQARTNTAVEETTDVNPLRHSGETELSRAEVTFAGTAARRDALAALMATERARLRQLEI